MTELSEEVYNRITRYLVDVEAHLDEMLEKRPVEADLLISLSVIAEKVGFIQDEITLSSNDAMRKTAKCMYSEVAPLFIKNLPSSDYPAHVESSKAVLVSFRKWIEQNRGKVI